MDCFKKYLLFTLCLVLQCVQASWAAGYLIEQGKGYVLCEAMKRRLDKLGPLKKPLYCEQRIVREIPGIRESDWQDIDVEAHWELFVKLRGHGLRPRKFMTEQRFDQLMDEWREDSKVGKAKLQILRANIELYDDSLETIARVWKKNGCDGKSDYASINFVTENLKGIDLIHERRALWFPNGDLITYKGRYYVVFNNYGDFIFSSDFGAGLVPLCVIGFH